MGMLFQGALMEFTKEEESEKGKEEPNINEHMANI
jgi:hypothetical protein